MEKLKTVERAEQLLLDLGLRQVRVRHHGNLARIETDEDGFDALMKRDIRETLYGQFKEIGFSYVSLDLLGYRMGSMNEAFSLQLQGGLEVQN